MNIPDKKIHSQHHFVTMLTVQIYLRDWEVQVYVPPSDATNTGCTVRDALYAIGYPGPLINHLACCTVWCTVFTVVKWLIFSSNNNKWPIFKTQNGQRKWITEIGPIWPKFLANILFDVGYTSRYTWRWRAEFWRSCRRRVYRPLRHRYLYWSPKGVTAVVTMAECLLPPSDIRQRRKTVK